MDYLYVDDFDDLINKRIINDDIEWIITSALINEPDCHVFIVKKRDELDKDYVLKLEEIPLKGLSRELDFYFKISNDFLEDDVNILPLIDHELDIKVAEKRYKNIVLPKMKTSLHDYLSSNDFIFGNYEPDLKEIIGFFTKMVQAIEFINVQGYIHGDIKPQNIVFDTLEEPYIIDFGTVADYKKKRYLVNAEHVYGSLIYLSPDLHNGIISQRSDLISLGFIMFIILENIDLPWCNLAMKEDARSNIDTIKEIYKMKNEFVMSGNKYYQNKFLSEYFRIVNSKNYYEKPLYNEIYELVELLIKG